MKTKKANIIFLMSVLMLTMFVVSCRSRRNVTTDTAPREMKASDIIRKTALNTTNYQYLSANVTANVARKNSLPIRLTGQMRMRHDSVVWLNLTGPLGIGTFRVLATNDSVWITNSIEKTCRCGKINKVLGRYGIAADFVSLENALVCNGTILPQERFEVGNEKIEPSDNIYVVPTQQKQIDMLSVSEIQVTSAFKMAGISANYGKQGDMMLNYSNFIETEAGIIPRTLNLQLDNREQLKVNVEYSKITINEKKDFPFKIGTNYKIIGIK